MHAETVLITVWVLQVVILIGVIYWWVKETLSLYSDNDSEGKSNE